MKKLQKEMGSFDSGLSGGGYGGDAVRARSGHVICIGDTAISVGRPYSWKSTLISMK